MARGTAMRLRSLTSSGRVADASMLMEKGFQVGTQVTRKSDEVTGIIKAMAADSVILMVAGVEKQASAASFLQNEWKQVAAKAPAEKIENWGKHAPEHSTDLFTSALKGKIVHQLKSPKVETLPVDIFSKPKDVIVTGDVKAGKLRIPVSTLKLEVRSDDKVANSAICIGKAHQHTYILAVWASWPQNAILIFIIMLQWPHDFCGGCGAV